MRTSRPRPNSPGTADQRDPAAGPADTGIVDVQAGASRRWPTIVILAVIVFCAAWLRFAELGRLSLWPDEYPHVIAGRSLFEEGRPLLPSGREYRRALLQTIAVGGAMRVLGESEASARVPSALVGLATIPLVWYVARRRFGEAAALAAAAALAIMPVHVVNSRSARFYVLFALAYSMAMLLAARALRTRRAKDVALAVGSFAVAFHLQPLALLGLVPFAVDAVIVWKTSRRPSRRRGLPIVLAVLAALAIAALALLPATRDAAVRLVRDPVPGVTFDPSLRLVTFGRLFGFVSPAWAWALLGPAALAGLWRLGRDGAALAAHLIVPSLVLSLAYRSATPTQAINSRYLVHLGPALALVAGVAVAVLLGWAVRGRALAARPGRRVSAWLALTALLATVTAGGVTAFRLPMADHPGPIIPRPNWRAASELVLSSSSPDDALVSTHPLAMHWYLGRCAVWLRTVERASPYMDGGRDVYCGSVLVHDAATLSEFVKEHPRGWLVVDGAWSQFVDASTRSFVEAHLDRLSPADQSVMVFRWSP